jgi:uncharacterized protein
MALTNGILIADVSHQRLLPKKHSLRYTVYYLAFPLARMTEIVTRLCSVNRWNIFSFRESDHGFNPTSCEAWVRSVLAEYKLDKVNGEVVLVTMPKLFGYAFNPVSFWFCLDTQGGLRAVVSEVNNTFNERHAYVSFHDDQRAIAKDDWLESQKVFHVSPFLEVRGNYKFRFAYGEEKIGVWIHYYDAGEKMLTTAMVGKRIALTDGNLIRCFLKYPLVTLKVISMIHVHAVRLITKGIRYHRKPTPPAQEITR